MKTLFFLLLLTLTCCLQGQAYLNTPLEILTFMEASPTQYEVEQLYGDIPTQKAPVIPHGTYISTIEDKEYQQTYQADESSQVSEWKRKARDIINIERPNYEKARNLYQKILNKNPQNAQIHTFIGETYYEQQQYQKALLSFQKAIELNPIDHLARWLSAEIYLKQGAVDSALTMITLAHIYNRNHPRLLKRMIEIYEQQQQSYYRNWSFAPKMYVYKDGDKVVITADGIWLTYGMYKAVWNYDPDYQYVKDQQAVSDYMFYQEMEASLGTYMTYSALKQDDKRNYPAMNALGDSLDEERFEEFVMYEILLVNNPTLAYHTTPAFLERLIQYISSIRSKDYNNM